MSDIHVLNRQGQRRWRLVFHYPVPNVNNAVGVNFRTAIVNAGLAQTVLQEGTGPGEISTAELALINNGEIFEAVHSFEVESGGTSNADLIEAIEELYSKLQLQERQRIQGILRYFGFTRDLP